MQMFIPAAVRFLALTAACGIILVQRTSTDEHYTVIQLRDWALSRPAGIMRASDGNFYGTSGDFRAALFRMTPEHRLETLYRFEVDPRIGFPVSPAPHVTLIEASDGLLYGTTTGGGAHGGGTIFRVSKTGDVYETLYDFHGTFDGCGPGGLVEAPDGMFYGMAECGAGGLGVVYRIDRAGNFTLLRSYGSVPDGLQVGVRGELLTLGSDGALYGPLSIGSAPSSDGLRYATGGGILRVDRTTGEVKTIVVFPDVRLGGPNTPNGGFVEMSDGSFYGTSKGGGAESRGTIFRLSGSGDNWAVTVVHSFRGSQGARPESGFVMGADGWLYGTTRALEQMVFRFHVGSRTFETVHGLPSFQGDGREPYARMIATSDAVYGTTFDGGTSGDGVIFRADVRRRQPTTIVADAALGTYAEPLPLTARLAGPDGPLPDKTVRFFLNGAAAGQATTDGNGVASFSAPIAGGLDAGAHPCGLVARFDGDADYDPSAASADVTIAKATPVVVWPQPTAIVAGTALGPLQLNATSNVAGSFVYAPPAGTMFPFGTGQLLSVTFTPTDTRNHTTATATTTITVTAPPRLVAHTGVVTTRENVSVESLLSTSAAANTALGFTVTTPPMLGTVELLDAVGRFRYTPRPGATGYDTFTYSVSDGVESSTGTQLVLIVARSLGWPGDATRATIASDGTEANAGNAYDAPSLSADGGTVAFYASSSNLVPGDIYATPDIFVHQRATRTTSLVTVSIDGGFANAATFAPRISADGRFVAFRSDASNLVPDDWNRAADVFLRDLATGRVTRVSVASDGTQANAGSEIPAISADGRFVAFSSAATNLVPGGTSGGQAFVHDRLTAQTTLVSVAGTTAANAPCFVHAISADGRIVAFTSTASNLVPGDSAGTADLFVHDRRTGQTTRVALTIDGATGGFVLSADGRFVTFAAHASNHVPGDTNQRADIFVHDRYTGQTTRVSVASDGTQGNGHSLHPAVSADGRFVAFSSDASNLVDGDSNGAEDVFVHDRETGLTRRFSVSVYGADPDGSSHEPAISADGRVISFYSAATNLIPGDTNTTWDVFVVEAFVPEVVPPINHGPVARSGVVTTTAGASVAGTLQATDPENDALTFAVMQQPALGVVTITDAATGAFLYTANADATGYDPFSFSVSDGTNTVAGTQIVFVVAAPPAWAGRTMRVSVASDGTEGNGPVDSDWGQVSADGRFVAFSSIASTLVAGDTNGAYDVFVHDRQTGATSRVSLSSTGAQTNHHSRHPVVSADGRYVAFWSDASNLVAGDTNSSADVFLHDRQTGQTSRLSVATDGSQGNNTSYYPSISADGRFVSFSSMASNLVNGDTNANWDVFVHDRQTGHTSRVSVASDGAQGNNTSLFCSISADGRLVAFTSFASNLVAADSNGTADVFVRDRQTAQTTRVSVASGGTQANGQSLEPAISGDGRIVAFSSFASNLVSSDTNAATDVFVHDRLTGETTRVSVASDGTEGLGSSSQPGADGRYSVSLSADGRVVTFSSLASNLVPGDTNGTWDVFAHDRQTGQTTRVSVASDGTQGNATGFYSSISADGRVIAFGSLASNLVPADTNAKSDVFAVEDAPRRVPVVDWPAPASIVYGTPLSADQLDATADVAGVFTYEPAAGAVLSAGTHVLRAVFTPADPARYEAIRVTVSIDVAKAAPSLQWSQPVGIVFPTALGARQLNAIADIAGTITYAPAAGAVLPIGTHQLHATFTPDDAENYTTAAAMVTLTVIPITVNSANDVNDGVCDAAHCSMREAILFANANPGIDTVRFALAGPSPDAIRPLSALPPVISPVVIDGTTQPGFSGSPIVEIDGTLAGDGVNGLVIAAADSIVRGLVINRFKRRSSPPFTDGHGIAVTAPGARIEGNLIGTDRSGTLAAGNGGSAVLLSGTGAIVGGPTPVQRNVLSGNPGGSEGNGVQIHGANNRVEGNFIGTDVTGVAPIANFNGITIRQFSSGNAIVGNVIAGNMNHALLISGTDNIVRRNRLGVRPDEDVAVPGSANIQILNGSRNLIGGRQSGDGNFILGGIWIPLGGDRNAIEGNRIYGDITLGFNFDLGFTPNDPLDVDTGPNQRQNFPVVSTATAAGAATVIAGVLDSAPGQAFRIELFENTTCNPSGHGGGQRLVGVSESVVTDSNGHAEFSTAAPAQAGRFITATATDANGNTSEFSECRMVRTATRLSLASSMNPSGASQPVTLTAAVTAAGPAAGPATGVVTFFDGGVAIGQATLASGIASITTAGLAPGVHAITAEYAGDDNYGPSAGSLNQTVQAPAHSTSTTVSVTPSSSEVGAPAVVSAIVTAFANGVPRGTVHFYDGDTLLGSATLQGPAGRLTAEFATTFAVAGAHVLRADYQGDGVFAGSRSNPVVHTVFDVTAPQETRTTLVSPKTAAAGETIRIDANVRSIKGARRTPAGTVVLYLDGQPFASSSLSAERAVFFVQIPTRGLHRIVAQYLGDAAQTFAGSTSGEALLRIE